MENVNDISKELKSMGSALADMSRQMPYSIPNGYFEMALLELHETIKELQVPDTATFWGKTLPFTVPVGYFNDLTDKIVHAATTADESQNLPKMIPFTVPQAYFESFPAQMLEIAKASEPAKKNIKKIPLKPNYAIARVRWAAAAVILICISAGSYITFFNSTPAANPEKILASVPDNEIQDYLQHNYPIDINRMASNNEIASMQLDNKDIIQYLNQTGWDVSE